MIGDFRISDFFEDVVDTVVNDIADGEEYDIESIEERIREQIDNECMYYMDSADVIVSTQTWTWEDYAANYGEINSITTLAYCILEDYMYQNDIAQEVIDKLEATDED